MKWVRNWWMIRALWTFRDWWQMIVMIATTKRRQARILSEVKTLRANNVHYRRACEAAIKGIRNADSMLAGATTHNPNVRAAQSQLRFSLNATCEFIARVDSDGDV